MNTRSVMRYRTVIERKTSTSDNAGGFDESWNAVQSDVPCYAWYVSSRTAVLSDRPSASEIRFVLVPYGTDIHIGDRLAAVTTRLATVIFDGPLIVDAVGEREDHLALTTRKID